jgi:type IX secretion system PorP/SprF family membrane protein
MRKLLLTICLLPSLVVTAQQLPVFSGFQMNKVLINPAETGAKPYADFRLHHRTQWSGFDNAPKTSLLSVHSSIDKVKFGIGLTAFSDEHGIQNTTGVNIGWAYHIPLSADKVRGGKLSFGLNGTYAQYGVDGSKITVMHTDDNLLDLAANSTNSAFDAGFGMLMHNQISYFGISALNLLSTNIKAFDNALIPNVSHIYAIGGRDFPIGEKSAIVTGFLVDVVKNNSTQFDLRVGYDYDQLFQFGLGYRNKDALIINAGIFILPNLGVHYYYDMTLSKLKTTSSGSHEIMLTFMWFYKPIYRNIRKRNNLNLVKPTKE